MNKHTFYAMSVWANKHITNESMGKQTLDVKCLGANILSAYGQNFTNTLMEKSC